jgi:hypothetical protein
VHALQRWESRRTSFSSARIREIGRTFEWPSTVATLSNAYLK